MATGSLRRGAAHASKLWRLQSAHEADAREPVLLVDDQMVAMLLGDYVAEIGGFRLDVAATRAEALRRLRYFCAVVSHALQDAA